jgi:4-hydroxy-tetrahydrodipicolinate synthase
MIYSFKSSIIQPMTNTHPLSGVYAAAVTPLKSDYSTEPEALLGLLEFLAERGCHGALLFGTTGEGPSFAPRERLDIWQSAVKIRKTHPDFHLLAGTGTPSLEETIELTQAAFVREFDAVVVLPPYYFRMANEDGLFAWYSLVIQRAVPAGKFLLGYHIPSVSGVGLSLNLLARLKEAFPDRFAGLKDSSADLDHARKLGERFGNDLLVLTGTDRLFSQALQMSASGCITALANICSPDLRRVWDAHQRGEGDPEAQGRLSAARRVSESYPPAPPLLKYMLARRYGFPLWPVRPPLLPLPPETAEKAASEMNAASNV